MPLPEKRRIGGLSIDPGVSDFLDGAATNQGTQTRKQQYDRRRRQVRLDVEAYPEIAEVADRFAAELGTSRTQLLVYLLAQELADLAADDTGLLDLIGQHRTPAKGLNIQYDLSVPDEVLAILRKSGRK